MSRDDHDLQLIDLFELLGLCRGRSSHPRQTSVHAKVVLEGNSCQRQALPLNVDVLLGLDGLVKSGGVAPTIHETTGELVHDDDLAVGDDIIAVSVKERLGLEGVVEIGRQLEILGRVKILHAQGSLDFVDSLVCERCGTQFLIDDIARILAELPNDPCKALILACRLFGLAGDDQRRPRLVDENVVHLIHDGIVELSLGALPQVPNHVVAQIVKAELVVRAVGDIRFVGILARAGPKMMIAVVGSDIARIKEEGTHSGVRTHGLDDADAKAQRVVYRPHPLGTDLGQIVVGRHQMCPSPRQCVQVERERGDERLSLAGLHLCDLVLVQDDAAEQLHIKETQADGAYARFAHEGKSSGQNLVEDLALISVTSLFERLDLASQDPSLVIVLFAITFLLELGNAVLVLGRGVPQALLELACQFA